MTHPLSTLCSFSWMKVENNFKFMRIKIFLKSSYRFISLLSQKKMCLQEKFRKVSLKNRKTCRNYWVKKELSSLRRILWSFWSYLKFLNIIWQKSFLCNHSQSFLFHKNHQKLPLSLQLCSNLSTCFKSLIRSTLALT